MSLYTPSLFDARDRAAVARLMHDHPFATLVTPTSPEPRVSHVPLLLVSDCEPHGTLIGHVARANPHWQSSRDAESIAIFHGPHAYVSPSWYGQHPSVPTWNYIAVHAYGAARVIEGPVVRDILARLVATYEAKDSDWSMAALPEGYMTGMERGIVAFEILVTRLEAKTKLSQNRGMEDRKRVIARLQALGGDDNLQIAQAMRTALEPA